MNQGDRELRRLFQVAREDDGAAAPSFARSWEAARRHAGRAAPAARRAVPRWGWATLAAAALVAVAFVTLRPGRDGRPDDLEREIALACEISAWEGPTSGLAALATLTLLDEVPSLSLSSLALPDDTGFATADKAEDAEDASSAYSEGLTMERGWR